MMQVSMRLRSFTRNVTPNRTKVDRTGEGPTSWSTTD